MHSITRELLAYLDRRLHELDRDIDGKLRQHEVGRLLTSTPARR